MKWYANRFQEQSRIPVSTGGGMDGDVATRYHLLRIPMFHQYLEASAFEAGSHES